MPKKTKKQKGRARISSKISMLMSREGKTQEQAVGQALGMARSGDLGAFARAAAGKKPRKRKRRMA